MVRTKVAHTAKAVQSHEDSNTSWIRDLRVPCANANCHQLCAHGFCSPACRAVVNAPASVVTPRPSTLPDWQVQQYEQAYRDDQVRTTAAAPQPVIHWAFFAQAHGQAWKDSAGVVWFLADDSTTRVLLHNEDAPALQLLGLVDLAEAQAILDARVGGYAGVVTSRRQEA